MAFEKTSYRSDSNDLDMNDEDFVNMEAASDDVVTDAQAAHPDIECAFTDDDARDHADADARLLTNVYSFDELVVPLYEEMLQFARRLTCEDHAGAEDIVQDAMMKAMLAWPRWSPEDEDLMNCARAWMYRIVNNTFIKRYHSAKVLKKRHEGLHHDIIAFVHGDPDERLGHSSSVDGSVSDEVLAAIGTLSIDHREIMLLRYMDGLDCIQIAERLNMPKNTVFTRLARARATLGRLLKGYAQHEYRIGLTEKPTAPQAAVKVRKRAAKPGSRSDTTPLW